MPLMTAAPSVSMREVKAPEALLGCSPSRSDVVGLGMALPRRSNSTAQRHGLRACTADTVLGQQRDTAVHSIPGPAVTWSECLETIREAPARKYRLKSLTLQKTRVRRIPSNNSDKSVTRGKRRLQSVAKKKGLYVRVPSRKMSFEGFEKGSCAQRTPSANKLPGLGTSLPSPGSRKLRRRLSRRLSGSMDKESKRSVGAPSCSRRGIPLSTRHTPITPWRKWVIFKHEEDPEEKENNIEIGLGSIKAQIPLVRPGTKAITIIRVPSMPRSPTSAFQFSFAFQYSFPLCFKLAEDQEALIPVALGFSLSLSLLPLLAGVGQGVAETGLQVNFGQAEAEIPLSMPLVHLPHFLALTALFPHVPALTA